MKDFLEKIKSKWKGMKSMVKVTIAFCAIAVVVGGAVLWGVWSQTNYSVLYTGMAVEETGEIYNYLIKSGVDVQVLGQDTILVPDAQKAALKAQLSAEGFPKTGLSYDMYLTNGTTFGTTDFDKQVYYKFQLEQNVAQLIKQVDAISEATVMITPAKESRFLLNEDMAVDATASVVLSIKPGSSFGYNDAQVVRNIVATAIPQLKKENITIVDTGLNAYDEKSQTVGVSGVTEQLAITQSMRDTLTQRVYDLLLPVFGDDNLSVAVDVTMDFNKKVTESIIFEPPVEGQNEGIIISRKMLEEKAIGGETAQGLVGTDPNGGAPNYAEIGGMEDADTVYYKQSNEYNAEVNEIKERIESAQGGVTALSVAVILNGDNLSGALLTDVRNLVAQALGVTTENVAVSAIRFAGSELADQPIPDDTVPPQETIPTFWEGGIFGIPWIYIIGAGIVLLLILFIVISVVMTVRRRRKMEKQMREMQEEFAREREELERTVTQRALGVAIGANEDEISLNGGASDSVKQVRSMADKSPELIAQLIRNWFSND